MLQASHFSGVADPRGVSASDLAGSIDWVLVLQPPQAYNKNIMFNNHGYIKTIKNRKEFLRRLQWCRRRYSKSPTVLGSIPGFLQTPVSPFDLHAGH